MDALYGHRCGLCGGFTNSAEHKIKFSAEALTRGLQEIFGGFNVKDNIQADIFRETLRLFNQAAARGISEAYDEKAITDEFLEQVRHNNEVFSAFRTHRMQIDIARQLLDGKGRLKSYEQFRRDVAPLTGKYCDQWLNTEYNTAVIRAHRAADWKHFETEIDVYPNLRWAQTTSAVPDKVHQFFWSQKLTLPVNDPFWQRHHPGERWGCKCTCEQTDEPVNDLGGLAAKYEDTASKGLHGNPAQTGQLFSEDHPYYPKNCGSCPFTKGAKNHLGIFLNRKKDCASCQAVENIIQKENTLFDIGDSMVRLYDLDNKHLLDEVKAITSSKIFKQVEKNIFSAIGNEDNDYERLLAVARKASSKGYTSFILPNPRKGRTPDIILQRKGIFKIYDVKTIVGTNSVSSRLADSVGQTHRVLLHITSEYNPRQLAKEIKTFLEDNIDTIEVTVLRGNKEITVSHAAILDKHFIQKFIMNYKR